MAGLCGCTRKPARFRPLTPARTRRTSSPGPRCFTTTQTNPDRAPLASRQPVRQTSSEGLRVEIAPDRERVTVRAEGEIDLATIAEVERPVLELLDSGFGHVVVDMRAVTFMDSSGIRLLIGAHRQAVDRGASLSIVVGGSRIRKTLELSGAIDYLGVS
jgi:anti-sigma B factor antagonist